jgi:hypothetical protein
MSNSLTQNCISSCCYYVCVETYNEQNECSISTIQINFEGSNFNIVNNQEYLLIIEGNCVNPDGDTISITNTKDDCYGCSIEKPIFNKNICNQDSIKIIAHNNGYVQPTITNQQINLNKNTNLCDNDSIKISFIEN